MWGGGRVEGSPCESHNYMKQCVTILADLSTHFGRSVTRLNMYVPDIHGRAEQDSSQTVS